MEKDTGRYHYCVLYTPALEQDKLRRILVKNIPEGRGTVFYPCMEVYRRGSESGRLKQQAIFPGYIFIRSDMKAAELHEFIGRNRRVFSSIIRELSRSERMAAGEPPFSEGENYDYTVSDLNEEETAFLDFLLNIGRAGSKASVAEDKKLRPEDRIEGLLRMSYGYREKGKDGRKDHWRVVRGPLLQYEEHIEDVNVHDKKAFLDFKVGGRVVRAGFDVRPKREFYPDDKDAPELLSDGTEVDIDEIIHCMTKLS